MINYRHKRGGVMDAKTEIAKKRAELEKINKKIEALEQLKEIGEQDANFFRNFLEGMEIFEIPLLPAGVLAIMTAETWEDFEPDKDASTAGKIATRTLGALCCLPMATTALLFATPVLMLFGPITAVCTSIESTKNAIHNKRLEKVDEKLAELKEKKAELEEELSVYDANLDGDEVTA